ncbi:MAG TPA: AAA family ATPase, partial [Thermomicrobiales bacterium]|nr:AAA family ATPase [Thermomicrobiales bacterium]
MAIHSPSGSTSLPEMTPLVGRGWAQAALRDRLAQSAGRGAFVLISGPAGIGKTSLVRWLAIEATPFADAKIGHAYDLTLTPPYGPWIEALADNDRIPLSANPLSDGAELDSISSQPLLFERTRRYLEQLTVEHPLVLALEDLHWSDPASLELLRFLAHGIDRMRLLLVATYRSDELTREQPLYHLLPHLVREAAAERIDLQTLNDHDVREFVSSRYRLLPDDEARLTNYLQARGQGNPFYLTELLRTLEGERVLQPAGAGWQLGPIDRATVPPLVRQIVEGRLATLDDETRVLLDCASVIGQDVPLDRWQAASGAGADAIALAVERAGRARLIGELSNGAGIAFTHALIRETLYNGLSFARRRQLHQRVAEYLVQRADPPLNVVASHFARAGDPHAIDWLVRAGERAFALYAA